MKKLFLILSITALLNNECELQATEKKRKALSASKRPNKKATPNPETVTQPLIFEPAWKEDGVSPLLYLPSNIWHQIDEYLEYELPNFFGPREQLQAIFFIRFYAQSDSLIKNKLKNKQLLCFAIERSRAMMSDWKSCPIKIYGFPDAKSAFALCLGDSQKAYFRKLVKGSDALTTTKQDLRPLFCNHTTKLFNIITKIKKNLEPVFVKHLETLIEAIVTTKTIAKNFNPHDTSGVDDEKIKAALKKTIRFQEEFFKTTCANIKDNDALHDEKNNLCALFGLNEIQTDLKKNPFNIQQYLRNRVVCKNIFEQLYDGDSFWVGGGYRAIKEAMEEDETINILASLKNTTNSKNA